MKLGWGDERNVATVVVATGGAWGFARDHGAYLGQRLGLHYVLSALSDVSPVGVLHVRLSYHRILQRGIDALMAE